MDKPTDDYHISFFKPTTEQATANRNMVIWLVLIWFIAIFGFHGLLWVIEKPTPEPAYTTFQKVWENVKVQKANQTQLAEFGQTMLSVLGKVAIAPADRAVLDDALSYTVYQLVDDTIKPELVGQVKGFETLKNGIEDIVDQQYIDAKKSISDELSPLLKLTALDVRTKILPLELVSENMENLTAETQEKLPGIMKKYLVHNQSFLTDFKFLGFPFHYFYTAVFLLILFVGLCWLYCVRTDSFNAKLNIID